jgi:hypothetical protein
MEELEVTNSMKHSGVNLASKEKWDKETGIKSGVNYPWIVLMCV